MPTLNYQMDSNNQVLLGRFTRPQWSINIAEGEFKNISLNTAQQVGVAQWPTIGQAAQPFTNWSGGVIASESGRFGAYAVLGSGHLINGAAYYSGVAFFDLETQLWSLRAYSENTVSDGDPENEYGESTDPSTAPYPFVPHTYDGLVYQPPSNGGGQHGRILQHWLPGTQIVGNRCARYYDLNPVNQMPVRFANSYNSGGNGYPATAADYGRNGYWLMSNNGAGSLLFISFADYSVTTFTNVDFPSYAEGNLIYIPAPYDCLVMIGAKGTNGVNFSFRVSKIINGVPVRFEEPTLVNNPIVQTRYQSGGVWSTLLNCIVSYPARGSYDVYKIIPPENPADVMTGSWTFEIETMAGKDGATPSNNGKTSDGAWSRFIEHVPSKTFIWCDEWSQPVQAWRLTGMV